MYTRTGDAGTSCLFNMERRDKDDAVFEALGDVDELGVAVGIANVFALECDDPACAPDLALLSERLVEIQSRLLDVGSRLMPPPSTPPPTGKKPASRSTTTTSTDSRRG